MYPWIPSAITFRDTSALFLIVVNVVRAIAWSLGALIRCLDNGVHLVYHQEYENHYQAQDGISKFIDYYNHRRPHQGIGFAGPYQKLTGQEKRIIKERRTRGYEKEQPIFNNNTCL